MRSMISTYRQALLSLPRSRGATNPINLSNTIRSECREHNRGLNEEDQEYLFTREQPGDRISVDTRHPRENNGDEQERTEHQRGRQSRVRPHTVAAICRRHQALTSELISRSVDGWVNVSQSCLAHSYARRTRSAADWNWS